MKKNHVIPDPIRNLYKKPGSRVKHGMTAIFVILFIVCCFIFPVVSRANDFETTAETFYYLDNPPTTKTVHKITIKNTNPTVYLTSYSLIFSEAEIDNVNCLSNSTSVPCVRYTENERTHIKVDFNDIVAGKNAVRHLEISYQNLSLAKMEGNTTDIFLPSQAKDDNSQNTIYLNVNKKLGALIYFSQKADSVSENGNYQIFRFRGDNLPKGVWASFGNTQYYNFSLGYRLSGNPRSLALPPDTAYQKIYLENVSPAPKSVAVDADGNWIATFERNVTQVKVVGQIQVFPKPRLGFSPVSPQKEPSPATNRYWSITNPKLLDIAKNLKTPQDINRYVVDLLSYDKNKINQDQILRLGADVAFLSPASAVCSEYTDLFVALAKLHNLPVAEVNGYAVNNDLDLEPTLLGKNILHAWPQYWDGATWKQVDPTWEDTGGRDYFKSFDLKHVTFVIHRTDPVYPYPPDTYQVVFGKPFGDTPAEIKTKTGVGWSIFPLGLNLEIDLTNRGRTSLENESVKVSFSETEKNIVFLPPYGTYKTSFYVSPKAMINLTQKNPTVNVAGVKHDIIGIKTQVIYIFLITFFAPIIVILGLLLFLRHK